MDADALVGLVQRFSAYDNLPGVFDLFSGKTKLFIPPLRTGADGRVRVKGLQSGPFEAIVDHPDHPRVVVRRASLEPESTIRVELRTGAVLEVRAPRYAGFVCEVDRAGLFPLPVTEATFDDRGVAALRGLEAGSYAVSVSRSGTWDIKVKEEGDDGNTHNLSVGRSTDNVLVRRTVTLVEGERTVLDLSDVHGATILGRLAADLRVPWMARLLSDGVERATSDVDAEGSFRFDDVVPGDYRIVALSLEGAGEVSVEKTISAGDTEVSITLRADRGIVVGTVFGPDGRPLAEANVFAVPEGGAAPLHDPKQLTDLVDMPDVRGGKTGEGGAYRIEPMPAGEYRLFCGGPGRLARTEVRLEDGDELRVDFRLDAAHLHPLAVRLEDEHGDPVAGHVTLRSEFAGLLAAFASDPDWLSPEAALEATRTFHLQEGRYLLDVYAEGKAPIRGHEVRLDGPETVTLRMRAGVPALLEIEDAKGPLANREVEVRDAQGRGVIPGVRPVERIVFTRMLKTDEAGRLTVPNLEPGRYTILVGGREAGSFEVGPEPLERRIRLRE